MSLSGKQRRVLRALGHHLRPVVLLGKEGLNGMVVDAVEQALRDHELIKVKVGETCPVDRHDAAEQLAGETSSEVAQVLGRTVLLFRRNPEKPQVEVPGFPFPKKKEAAEARPGPKGAVAKKATGKRPAAKKGAAKRAPAGKDSAEKPASRRPPVSKRPGTVSRVRRGEGAGPSGARPRR